MTKFLNNADVKGYISQTDVTSSLLKTDSSGKLVAAVAGTDYQTPTALANADRMVTVGRNATGATLYKGTIVYISGSTGNRPNFVKAQANSEATSAGTFGVVYADIPNNSDGNVVNIGVIDTLDTRASAPNPFTSDLLVDGDTLYLSPDTAGYVTKTKPSAPNHLVYVGKVTRTSPTNGTIVYRIQNGYELNEIHDVAIATLANNHTLVWESATNLWKNKTIAAALGYTPADDSSVVKLTGDQTVAGVKTFSSVINASTLSLNGGVLSGNNIVSMRSNPTGGQFRIEKSDGSLSAYPFYIGVDGTALAYYYNAAGALKVLLHTNDTSYFGNSLSVGYSTYASTSYMLDVNGTVRLTGALSGTSATFSGNVGIGTSITTNALELQGVNSQWALSVSAYTGASGSFGGIIRGGTNTNDIAFRVNNAANNVTYFNVRGDGAATFSSSVTAGGPLTVNGGSISTFAAVIQSTSSFAFGATNGRRIAVMNVPVGDQPGLQFGYDATDNTGILAGSTQANGAGIDFYTYDGSSWASRLRVIKTGQLKFNNYTSSSSFSGTAAGYLAFDSSGNVITVAGVAATDNTKLPLAGGTMTGALVVNTTGIANSPSVRINTSSSASFVHTQENFAANLVAGQRAMIFFGKVGSTKNAGGIGYYWAGDGSNSNFITLGHWGNDDLLRVYGDGTIQATGYLRTAGVTSNTVLFNSGASSVDFGNAFGQGTTNRSVYFRGNTGVSAWWGGVDANGANIPFAAIDATAGEFTFWRNSGGTGGGNWTNIMTMNASGLTINSGSFIGNLSGNASSSTYSSSVYIGGSSSKLIGDSVWAGTGGYPGYSFTGGNSRFGFSSTGGYIDVYTDGNFYAGIDLNGSNNLVLHAGNYNSYSPTLTGGGASGTWGISVSGNAASASAVAWSNVSSKPASWLGTTNLIDNNPPNTAVPSGFWQDYQGSGNPTGTWFNYINVRHNNPGNVHGYQLGMSYYDNNLWFRSYQGSGTYQSWAQALSTQNYSSYALPLSGGTMTGSFAVGNQQGNDNPGGWNKYILIDGTSHGRFRIKASNYSYGNIDVALWADSSVSPSHGISGSNSVFSFGGSITSLTVAGNTVWTTANASRAGNSNLMYYAGFTLDANNMPSNSTGFTYSQNAPYTGPIAKFSEDGYPLQLNATYSGGVQIAYRTRNGDAGSWNSWYSFITSANIGSQSVSYANYSGYTSGYSTSVELAGGNYIWFNGSGNHNVRMYESYGIVMNCISHPWHVQVLNGSLLVGRQASGQDFGIGHIYTNGFIRPSGDYGLYSEDYGGYFRRNTQSYGTWESTGYAKNGWGGYVNSNNYIVSWMLNTSGDFGFLTQNGNWWNLFYNNANNCWGIGTDNTYSGDGFRCIKYGSAQYGWTTWSDRRAKENISTITDALDKVLNMRGVYFNYIIDEAKNKRVGFIAQELQQALPEAVRYAEEIDEYNVEYGQIVSVLAEAVKEHYAKTVAQQIEIDALKTQLQTLLN